MKLGKKVGRNRERERMNKILCRKNEVDKMSGDF